MITNNITDENTLEPILVSEVYPKKPMQSDEDGLKAPFPALHGESVEFLGRTSDGIIALSNYRVFVLLKESFINIPIGIVESVEYRDIFYMHVFCKDARSFRCAFATNDGCLEWCKRLMQAIRPQNRLQEVFAFSFHAWRSDAKQQHLDGLFNHVKNDEPCGSVFDREVQRLCFDLKNAWRITHVNEDFKICASYPKLHIVPHSVTDKDIESIAGFRSSKRFPSIVWRDVRTGVVLARSSQPEVGWLGWRNTQDEAYLQAVAESCRLNPGLSSGDVHLESSSSTYNGSGIGSGLGNCGLGVNASKSTVAIVPTNLVIIDARSYAAAVANRAKGGGCECQDYYPNCEIMFMSLANIHTIRKSFLALRTICAMSPDQPGWLINLENTKWLLYISGLLKASVVVVNAIDKEYKPVLVHCSDGWDRTPQIVALAELMLDPYYRTLEGFHVLVEKEWIEFGHKFADRCGQGIASDDVNERCPVFLQWLDCVHQLLRQFPCAFQFNETYLVKLVQHVYSCLFGDFLCNTERDRMSQRVRQRTSSVWSLLSRQNMKFVNLLYRSTYDRVLRPSCHVQNLHFWDAVYLSETAPAMVCNVSTDELVEASGSEASSSSAVTSPDQQLSLPSKTRSCDDLTKSGLDDAVHPMVSAQRRLSDPNIAAHAPVASTAIMAECDCVVDRLPTFKNSQHLSNSNADTDENGSEQHINSAPLVALDTKKCASNETLKAIEDDLSEIVNGSQHNESETTTSRAVIMATFEASSETITDEDCPSNNIDKYLDAMSSELMHHGNKLPIEQQYRMSVKPMLDKCSSTSDISSSHIIDELTIGHDHHFADFRRPLAPLTVDTRLLVSSNCIGRCTAENDESNSQTPSCSSTNPPTPNGDTKIPLWSMKPSGKPSHCFDWDGLTYHIDPVQQRLAQIFSEYEQQLRQLEKQLNAARLALSRYGTSSAANQVDGRDELASNDSGERASSGASAVASDMSWEQIEEKDSHVTLWVPDHIVTHCAGCHQEFWMVRRKHHCRNCGHVFCGDCSDYSLPVPQQHLEKPVRVCLQCYNQAMASAPPPADPLFTENSTYKCFLGLNLPL